MTVKVAEPKIRKEPTPPKKEIKTFSGKTIKVLLVGNNPIELTKYYNLIYKFKFRRFEVDCCFCLNDCLLKMSNINPDCILIDDDYSVEEVKKLSGKIKQGSNIPVILLKGSIYKEIEDLNSLTFIHKETLSSDSLCRTILQTIKENPVKYSLERKDIKIEKVSSKPIKDGNGFLFLKRISNFVKGIFAKIMELKYRLKKV